MPKSLTLKALDPLAESRMASISVAKDEKGRQNRNKFIKRNRKGNRFVAETGISYIYQCINTITMMELIILLILLLNDLQIFSKYCHRQSELVLFLIIIPATTPR